MDIYDTTRYRLPSSLPKALAFVVGFAGLITGAGIAIVMTVEHYVDTDRISLAWLAVTILAFGCLGHSIWLFILALRGEREHKD